jgi:hypothetical protein
MKFEEPCSGDEMAQHHHHGEHEYSTAAGNDYAQHEAMYESFLAITKWTVIGVSLILIFLFAFVF